MPVSRQKYRVVTVRGKVEGIRSFRRSDGSEYWVLTIDGKQYSTFDPEHVSYIREGETVEYSYTDSGNYKRIVAIRRICKNSDCSNRKLTPETVRIVRMNCLRTAAELISDTKITPDGRASLAIEIARKLEDHVLLPQADYTPDAVKEGDT
ncbi:hypothetical protein ACFL4V_00175 [Candidatus Latescibacterota bacterium]